MKTLKSFTAFAAIVLVGMFLSSCNKEEALEAETLISAKKGRVVLADHQWIAYEESFCAGVTQQICFNYDGTRTAQVQLYDAATGEFVQIFQEANTEATCFYWTFEEPGTYLLRYFVSGQGGPSGVEFEMEALDCTECEESFTYDLTYNEDQTEVEVTFTYIPAEDFNNATLTFTFAQGVVVTGDLADWAANGVTRQMEMDLQACEEYTWTVVLTARCTGAGQSVVNAWTDFKVNNVLEYDEEGNPVYVDSSKKGDLENIILNCFN